MLTLLKLANMLACTEAKSFGSINITKKEAMLEKSWPKITPSSNSTIKLRCPLRK
ncbi:Uncharacterised protein [Vibrio cholerae]|nr:Uncharacterised protein [Vibrio cholerae]